jgi:hypothetical protein
MRSAIVFRKVGPRSSSTSHGVLLLALLLFCAVLVSSCARGDGRPPAKGSALDDEAVFTFGKKGIPTNQRFVLMLNDVVNESDEPLTVRELEPVSKPDPEVAILERLELAPRSEGSVPVEQGTHLTYPPGSSLSYSKKDCVYQDVQSPSGYVLQPSGGGDTRALMVMTIRTTGPGTTSFEVSRVVYEQGGRLYEQDVRLVIDLTVSESARPLRPSAEEAPCMDPRYAIPQPTP